MAQVVAGQDLPFAAVSKPIPARLVAVLPPLSPNEQVEVMLDRERGWLTTPGCQLERLVQSLKLAQDFHSCSLLLDRARPGEPGCLVLQSARPLARGEELTLWFSTDLQALLNIPFLSPLNIRGEKNYRCQSCEERFENPNPLKIHLALDCDKLKMSQLWGRLEERLDQLDQPVGRPLSPLQLTRESTSLRKWSVLDNWRPSSEPPSSAFRPVGWSCLSPPLLRQRPEPAGRDEERAVQLETLVSNLGISKQGHLCLYCGKIYSRKYGLKIHIRTHTGFKPLKCKYCLRPFGDPSNLNKHVRLHAESETPYRCELCGKMLVRRRDLERHMKSQHDSTEFI